MKWQSDRTDTPPAPVTTASAEAAGICDHFFQVFTINMYVCPLGKRTFPADPQDKASLRKHRSPSCQPLACYEWADRTQNVKKHSRYAPCVFWGPRPLLLLTHHCGCPENTWGTERKGPQDREDTLPLLLISPTPPKKTILKIIQDRTGEPGV